MLVELGAMTIVFIVCQFIFHWYACCYIKKEYTSQIDKLLNLLHSISIWCNLIMPAVFLGLALNNYNVLLSNQNDLIQSSKLNCSVTVLSYITTKDHITYFIELHNNNDTALVTGDCTTNCIIFNNYTDCWMVDKLLSVNFPIDDFDNAHFYVIWGIIQLVMGYMLSFIVICKTEYDGTRL